MADRRVVMFEVTDRIRLTDWLSVWSVVNPGLGPSVEDQVVIGLLVSARFAL